MRLSNLNRTSSNAVNDGEGRNGNGSIVDDDNADPASLLLQVLLDAIRQIVREEIRARDKIEEPTKH